MVTKGVLTHNDATCAVDGVYGLGQVIDERHGTG